MQDQIGATGTGPVENVRQSLDFPLDTTGP
jgi:hypothetical protein